MAIAQKAATRQVAKATQARAVRPVVVRGAVKCQAQKGQQLAKKAAAAVASVPALLAASPAFALVDDRLNGDGVGLALGVNDPVLGWHMVGVVAVLWTVYFIAQRDFGDFEDKDSGVGL